MFTTPTDVRNVLNGTLELTDEQLTALAEAMWRADLDPRKSDDVADGLTRIGLDPSDFGIGR